MLPDPRQREGYQTYFKVCMDAASELFTCRTQNHHKHTETILPVSRIDRHIACTPSSYLVRLNQSHGSKGSISFFHRESTEDESSPFRTFLHTSNTAKKSWLPAQARPMAQLQTARRPRDEDLEDALLPKDSAGSQSTRTSRPARGRTAGLGDADARQIISSWTRRIVTSYNLDCRLLISLATDPSTGS